MAFCLLSHQYRSAFQIFRGTALFEDSFNVGVHGVSPL